LSKYLKKKKQFVERKRGKASIKKLANFLKKILSPNFCLKDPFKKDDV
jgi:hypothetical protein